VVKENTDMGEVVHLDMASEVINNVISKLQEMAKAGTIRTLTAVVSTFDDNVVYIIQDVDIEETNELVSGLKDEVLYKWMMAKEDKN
jgi:predicted SpoU family rRNA methylase